jgi:hypothetical protein
LEEGKDGARGNALLIPSIARDLARIARELVTGSLSREIGPSLRSG